MYTYKVVYDVSARELESVLNKYSAAGWELFNVAGDQGNWFSVIFRMVETEPDPTNADK